MFKSIYTNRAIKLRQKTEINIAVIFNRKFAAGISVRLMCSLFLSEISDSISKRKLSYVRQLSLAYFIV